MAKAESIEEFYRNRLEWVPDYLKKEIGHFKVFRLDDFIGSKARPSPFNKKEFYKISLAIGNSVYYYGDKKIEIKESALLFSNPVVPYNWVPLNDQQTGYFCIFTEAFFNHFGSIREYPVFKSGNNSTYFLTKKEVAGVKRIYKKMQEEIQSDYFYKYDVLRNLVFELIHKAMKMQPIAMHLTNGASAGTRLSSLFIELLERQFPGVFTFHRLLPEAYGSDAESLSWMRAGPMRAFCRFV
jgi:hypothetical protein